MNSFLYCSNFQPGGTQATQGGKENVSFYILHYITLLQMFFSIEKTRIPKRWEQLLYWICFNYYYSLTKKNLISGLPNKFFFDVFCFSINPLCFFFNFKIERDPLSKGQLDDCSSWRWTLNTNCSMKHSNPLKVATASNYYVTS